MIRSLFVLVALGAGSAAVAQDTPFDDPAPPEVRELEAIDAPAPEPFPELTFHRAPQALAEGAVVQDWPCFRGPERDGRSRETHLSVEWGEDGPPLVWEMRRGRGYASPAVLGDRLVYTHRLGSQAHVDCLHPESGRRYWRFSYDTDYRGRYIANNGPCATPTIAGDRVYVQGIEGKLFCLELATGRPIWERDINGEFGVPDDFFGVVSSPLVHDDLLIQMIGAPGPTVAAFDLRTGRIRWGSGTKWGPSCASPVMASVHGRERVFVLAGGDSRPPTGGLIVADPRTGAVDFEYPFRSKIYESVSGADPVVAGERVFITASYGTGTAGLALGAEGGFEQLWKTRKIGMQFSNPVYVDGRLYAIDGVGGRAGALVGLDPETGKELTRTDLYWDDEIEDGGMQKTFSSSVGEGSLLYVDGRFLCLGDAGHLLWLDPSPEGAKVVARAWPFMADESWSPPVVSRGLLYLCQNNRESRGAAPQPARLLCYDLRR